ncbi:Uncharacterised protein [Neisseria flavescens]|nr:Uncharacterised protein [Neisseria meningitidis]SPY11727.1 Uncharacterised protein [Neisseria meningitidis]STZ66233.1 Uncharacterised protein [Neisseria flavescens]
MSTKIIENSNQLCYTVCFVFFTASAAKNRTIRLTTKPVNTFRKIISRKLITALFLQGFYFIKNSNNLPTLSIHTKKQNKGRLKEYFRRPFEVSIFYILVGELFFHSFASLLRFYG